MRIPYIKQPSICHGGCLPGFCLTPGGLKAVELLMMNYFGASWITRKTTVFCRGRLWSKGKVGYPWLSTRDIYNYIPTYTTYIRII